MTVYIGLDISQYETSICVVDDDGGIVEETKAATEPETIIAPIAAYRAAVKRIGLEACPLSERLFDESSAAGWPVVCLEGPASEGGVGRRDQQDGAERCARHAENVRAARRPDDAPRLRRSSKDPCIQESVPT